MKLVIPMAGEGRRFAEAGYKDPKPFIEVLPEVKMIELVLSNLEAQTFSQVVLLVRNEHLSRLVEVSSKLNLKNISFVIIDKLTEGAACTLLHAYDHLNTDEPIVIANSDQYIRNFDLSKFLSSSFSGGSILCFEETKQSPKWSYAQVDLCGKLVRVAEKNPISSSATCGVYYFGSGKELIRAAVSMISKNIRTNNEFYICPIYNQYRLPVNIHLLNESDMCGLGTPEDLLHFQSSR